jgi:ubiquinone biosynthesis protein
MATFSWARFIYELAWRSPLDPKRIEALGLLAIKLGQNFALRADLLSAERCTALTQLYRAVTPLSPAASLELLARETDDAWRDEVRDIDPVPMASASIGQVHRGRLRDGQPVVIKLVKRAAADQFEKDIAQALSTLRWIIRFYPPLRRVADPEGILASIRESTLSELDLRHEIEYQRVLTNLKSQYATDFDLHRLAFPQLHDHLSHERVLVSELIEGPTFDDLLTRGELRYETLLELFRLHGFYVFCLGTFHGDLHPGNLMLRGEEIVMVDTGALGHCSERLRRGLFGFMTHLSEDDYPRCVQALHQMSLTQLSDSALKKYERFFLDLYRDFRGKSVGEASLTRQMMHTIRSAVLHGMTFEPGMFPIIKTLMHLDGMVLRCHPTAHLLKDMRPFISEFENGAKLAKEKAAYAM